MVTNPFHSRFGYYSLGAWMVLSPMILAQMPPTPLLPDSSTLMDNGCQTQDNPISWVFQWSEVSNATAYQLRVMGANALVPMIETDPLATNDYVFQGGGYIIDPNRFGWRWSVRALVNGEWSDWSTEQWFDVEPLNTDCPAS